MERLRQGLVPRQMEDKWFVFYEPPHLFLHRSWTGLPVFRVTLADRKGGAQVVEALWAWPSKLDASLDPEYQAQLLDFLIGNLLLGECKPFPSRQTLPSRLLEFSSIMQLGPVTRTVRRSRRRHLTHCRFGIARGCQISSPETGGPSGALSRMESMARLSPPMARRR